MKQNAIRQAGYIEKPEYQRRPPKRLLIIEDDAALSEVLANIFTDLGFYCGFEADAPDISHIEAFNPDLILVDYHLPKVNGAEICEAVKQNINLAQVPVIVISAYSKIILNLDGSSFDYFIEKPFSIEEIMMPIKRLLASRKKVKVK